ncbi:unnamed protein product [Symbiodinium sp. CCMP2592]|nr:unnamed protein product [Symbiodinium sp. CCMP2592]CAE7265222.1 unnamed protein product [Symbiodinium sp. CCMP2592]
MGRYAPQASVVQQTEKAKRRRLHHDEDQDLDMLVTESWPEHGPTTWGNSPHATWGNAWQGDGWVSDPASGWWYRAGEEMWEDSEAWDGYWRSGRNARSKPVTNAGWRSANQTSAEKWEWWPQASRKVCKDTFKPTAAFHGVVSSEWTRGTEPVTKATVVKALSEGTDFKGNVLILHSPEQICELRDLWKSLCCERSLTVVAPQTSTEVFEGTVAKVTVRRAKGAMSLEHVVLWALGPKGTCTWPKPAVKTDFAKFEGEKKVTVRISAPEAYRSRFFDEGKSDSPAKLVKEVASWGAVPASQFTGGNWSWNSGNDSSVLVGYVRMLPAHARTLESYSGHHGVFFMITGTNSRSDTILWQDRLKDEDHESYLRRVRTKAQERHQGVKFRAGGGKDLGMVKLPSDSPPQKPGVFQVTGVPRSWDPESVQKFLMSQDWKDVEILSKRRNTWILKARPPSENADGPWWYEDEACSDALVQVVKAPPRTPQLFEKIAVPGPKRKFRTAEPESTGAKAPDKPTPKAKARTDSKTVDRGRSEVPATQLDPTSQNEENVDGKELPKRSRSRSEPRNQSPQETDASGHDRHPRAPADEISMAFKAGWKKVDFGGNGDCGYRSLVGALAHNEGEEIDTETAKRRGAVLRASCINHMRKRAEEYAPWIAEDADTAPEEEAPTQDSRLNRFLAQAADPTFWICGIQLFAACEKRGIPIVIWFRARNETAWKRCTMAPDWKGGLPRMAAGAKPVVLILQDDHYTFLQPPTKGKVPDSWLRQTDIPDPKVLQGSGPKSRAASLSRKDTASDVPSLHSWNSEAHQRNQARSDATPSLHSYAEEPARSRASSKRLCSQFQKCSCSDAPTPSLHTFAGGSLSSAFEGANGASAGSKLSLPDVTPLRTASLRMTSRNQASDEASLKTLPHASSGSVETPTWYCEECKEHIRPTSGCQDLGRGLSQARTAHIARRHPGRPSSDFPRIREVATVAAVHRRKLKGKAAWTCFWCRQVLPAMEKRSREASIKKHFQQCKKAPPESTAGSNLQAWAQELNKSHANRGAQSRCWGMILSKKLQDHRKAREISLQKHKLGHRIRHVLRCENDRARIIFTCSKCLHVARTRSSLARLSTPCPGVGVRARVLRTTGKQRLYASIGTQGRRLLKRIWGLSDKEHSVLMTKAKGYSTTAPLKQWLRDVTEEGIEPNPGPSTSLVRSPWSCFHLNAGGCTNAFEALDLLQSSEVKPLVWSLAEVRASPSEQAALTRRANKMGYRVWCVPSTQGARRQGPANWKGGLCVGVKDGVCCKQMATWCNDEGELLQLDFGSFRYMAAWRRPGGLRAAFDNEVALWASHAVAAGHSLVAVGDWNDEPCESPLEELGYMIIGPKQQDRYLASRWKGSRAIDWAMTNDPHAAFTARFLEHRISDHKCLWIEGCFSFNRVGQFSLSRTRDLSRPEHVPLEVWRDAVAAHFKDLEVHWDDDVDVQWAQLAAQLELSLQAASSRLDGPASRSFSRGGYRPKGSVATLCETPSDRTCKGSSSNEGARIRKLACFLGRLHEAKRLQQHPVADSAAVMAKIRATWPSDLRASSIEEAIPECEAIITKVRQQRRDANLTSWRARMAQGGREAARWLKNKAGLLAPALQYTVRGVTTTASSTAGSLELIVAFWKEVWRRPLPEDLHEQLDRMWTEHAPPQAAWPGDQGPLQAHELMKRARSHSKGSAGPDGISAENLADMPVQWWSMLAQLLQLWTAQNKFPVAWRESRMVLIPKDEVTGAAAEVARLRPITVFNTTYRVVAATWTARACVRDWLPQVCPPYFHGGIAGRNAWQALRHIEASWDEEAILISFDFEKCFDNVAPSLALDNLRRHGCPEDLLKVVAWTWLEQRRWIQYGSFVHPEPQQVSSSLPQGCPASPLALTALLLAPATRLQQMMGEALNQSIFVDDRTAVTRSAEDTERVIGFWAAAAKALGLQENQNKLKVVTRSARQRQLLRAKGIQPSAEATVLGTPFREDGLLEDQQKLTTNVKRALDVVQQGSRDLWLLLAGHWMDVGFALRLASASAFFAADAFWREQGRRLVIGRWGQSVGSFLQELQFTRTGAHAWQHAVAGAFDLSAGDLPARNKARHLMREAWRRQRYASFLRGQRHELDDLIPDDEGYSETVLKAAIKLYNGASNEVLDLFSFGARCVVVQGFPTGGMLRGAAHILLPPARQLRHRRGPGGWAGRFVVSGTQMFVSVFGILVLSELLFEVSLGFGLLGVASWR